MQRSNENICKSISAKNIGNSLELLKEFCDERVSQLIKEAPEIKGTNIEYPAMKILDSVLWEIGKKRKNEEKATWQ